MQILLNGKFLLITQRGIQLLITQFMTEVQQIPYKSKTPSLAYHNYKFRVILNRIEMRVLNFK